MKNPVFSLWIAALFLISIVIPCTHLTQAEQAGITWEATLYCNETSGARDTAVFGEAPDAHDGPPPDSYDVAKPPAPMMPYVRIILRDNLPAPYNLLWEDFRQYPDTAKIWNVTVQWVPEDGESSSAVSISWNPGVIGASEFTSVDFCTTTGTTLKDMLIESTYTFTCPANTPQNFKIICERNNTPPLPPSTPTGTAAGYHGLSYSYTTTATDPDGDSLYYQFDWGDTTTGVWLGPYPSGQTITAFHTWSTPNTYLVKVKAKDTYGDESVWSPALSVMMGNRAPTTPTSPTPGNGATNVQPHPTLHWNASDPDDDIITYDIYFGITSSPPRVVSQQTTTSFLPGILLNLTTYYWRIVACDPYGLNSTSNLWAFTTGSSGGGSGGGTEEQNVPPIADASASKKSGLPGAALTLDGSRSSDPDGYITTWSWTFGDNTSGTGEITTHIYLTTGTYQVTLTVIDDKNATDSDTISVGIISTNHPPTRPILQGMTHGEKNKVYTYTFSSTDPENDFLQYSIFWDDGTHNTSRYLPNGTSCSFKHSWIKAGKYTITTIANDNAMDSAPSSLFVYIDVYFINSLGFLYDANDDGINDSFYSNGTNAITAVQRLNEGRYQLDMNGDGHWDTIYTPANGALAAISTTEPESPMINPYLIIVLVAVTIIIIVGALYWYKKR